LIELRVKSLGGLIELHELIEGANLELGFIHIAESDDLRAVFSPLLEEWAALLDLSLDRFFISAVLIER